MILNAVSSILLVVGLKYAACYNPVATSTADNLSTAGCGLWDQGGNQDAPWTVAIRIGVNTCYAFLISPTTAFTGACGFDAFLFKKEFNTSSYAYVGKCSDDNKLTTCTNGISGQIKKVVGVASLNISNFFSLNAWKIEPVQLVTNQISPVCLFKKHSKKNSNITKSYFTFQWSLQEKNSVQLVEDVNSCFRENAPDELKAGTNLICARHSTPTTGQGYLVQEEGGRYFLRGVKHLPGKDDLHVIFTDLMPHFDEILSKSTGLTPTDAS